METGFKIGIGVLIAVAIYLIFKIVSSPKNKKAGTPPVDSTQTGFSPKGTGCPNISNLDNNGDICPPDCFNGCRSSMPGYDCNGTFSPNC